METSKKKILVMYDEQEQWVPFLIKALENEYDVTGSQIDAHKPQYSDYDLVIQNQTGTRDVGGPGFTEQIAYELNRPGKALIVYLDDMLSMENEFNYKQALRIVYEGKALYGTSSLSIDRMLEQVNSLLPSGLEDTVDSN